MSNSIETESFRLEIVSDDDDTTAQATQQLRTNLMKMEHIEAVERPAPSMGEGLSGSKGDAFTLGLDSRRCTRNGERYYRVPEGLADAQG